MPRYAALLRAINAGAGRTIKMETLRQIFENLGYQQVSTFMASGNVVFETPDEDIPALEKRIESRLREALLYEADTFIRTEAELVEAANYQPIPSLEAAELNIIFLKVRLEDNLAKAVTALKTDSNEFYIHKREIYWLRRRNSGVLDYSTVPLEKTLGRPFTIRSVRTVRKMVQKFNFGRT